MDLLEAANTLKQDNAVLNQTLGVISFHFNLDGLFIYYSTRLVSKLLYLRKFWRHAIAVKWLTGMLNIQKYVSLEEYVTSIS